MPSEEFGRWGELWKLPLELTEKSEMSRFNTKMLDHLWQLIELCKGSFCCYRAMNNPPGMFRLKVEIICIHMNIDGMTYWTDLLLIKWRINLCRTARNVIRVTWNVVCRVIEKWTTSMCKFYGTMTSYLSLFTYGYLIFESIYWYDIELGGYLELNYYIYT